MAGTAAEAHLDTALPRPVGAVTDPARVVAIDCAVDGAKSCNRYAFGGGNPVSNVELDGHVVEAPGGGSACSECGAPDDFCGCVQNPVDNVGSTAPVAAPPDNVTQDQLNQMGDTEWSQLVQDVGNWYSDNAKAGKGFTLQLSRVNVSMTQADGTTVLVPRVIGFVSQAGLPPGLRNILVDKWGLKVLRADDEEYGHAELCACR